MAIKMQDLFTNKAHASPEDKDAVQCSNFHKLISFISVEGQQHSYTFVLIELMPLKGRKQVQLCPNFILPEPLMSVVLVPALKFKKILPQSVATP